MNEEEIRFNKLHDRFKNSVLNKKTLTLIECAEFMNLSREKINELINNPNTDFPYFKEGEKVLINKDKLQKWLKKWCQSIDKNRMY